MSFSKAKTSLASGETIAKVYCLTSQGNIIEASGDMIGTIISSGGVNLTQQIAELQESVDRLNDLYSSNVEGYVRVAGTSDPALGFKAYSRGAGDESVFDCIRPCLIESGTGKLLYVLNNLNWYEDEYGHPRAIDGSEGEVYITNIHPLYIINRHVTVGNVTYDVFLRSRGMFTWQGHSAECIEPFGLSPDNCVAHQDSDSVTRMHSVYNESWNGSYQAMNSRLVGKFIYNGVGDSIAENYDSNGSLFGGAGGLHTTNLNLPTGEQYAMNMNTDRSKTVPFFNEHAHATEVMVGHIIAEGGTFDAHKSALMGSGFCSNDAATSAARWNESDTLATNGVRYVGSDNATKYIALSSKGLGGDVYAAQLLNDWRSPWRIMERQRVMFYAMQNNIPELTWFAFEGNKYKWRHIDGFAGPSEGVLTCVVWKMFSTKGGTDCVDPVTAASITGKRIDFMFCGAMYRGWNTDVSPSRWMSGLIFTEDETGLYKAYYQPDQSKMLLSPTTDNASASTVINFEGEYDHIGDIQGTFESYRRDYNDRCLFLPKSTELAKSGGLHTYVGGYNWFTGTAANAGCRSVRGFRRGLLAASAALSPLSLHAVSSPSYSTTNIGFGTCVQVDTDHAVLS